MHVPPTDADGLSVTVTGIEPVFRAFGRVPPKVVEVRVNGRKWSQLGDSGTRDACAPLVALDGRAVDVRLPRDPHDVLAGKLLELDGCEPLRLGPGKHRIETLPGLSGAVRTASLVPRGKTRDPRELDSGPRAPGTVDLVDRSPTRLRLRVDAPDDALLVGGMPAHRGWVADEGELRRYPVPLDTFAAWTVEKRTAGPVTLQFGPQQIYELALALSVAAAAWCVWRVTRRRRRSSG